MRNLLRDKTNSPSSRQIRTTESLDAVGIVALVLYRYCSRKRVATDLEVGRAPVRSPNYLSGFQKKIVDTLLLL